MLRFVLNQVYQSSGWEITKNRIAKNQQDRSEIKDTGICIREGAINCFPYCSDADPLEHLNHNSMTCKDTVTHLFFHAARILATEMR